MAGYIGSKASVTVTSPETDSRYVNVTGDTMNGTLLAGNVARNVDGIRIQSNQSGTSYGLRIGSDGSTDPLEFWREHSNGDQKQFSVDYFGRVTMPYQPAFAAYDSTGTQWNNQDVIPNVKLFDRGNNYNTSNGRFTAPVNGVYLFKADWRTNSTSATWMDIRTSNGRIARHEETAGSVNTFHQTLVLIAYMNANDYAYVLAGNLIRWDPNQINTFSGVLIG